MSLSSWSVVLVLDTLYLLSLYRDAGWQPWDSSLPVGWPGPGPTLVWSARAGISVFASAQRRDSSQQYLEAP